MGFQHTTEFRHCPVKLGKEEDCEPAQEIIKRLSREFKLFSVHLVHLGVGESAERKLFGSFCHHRRSKVYSHHAPRLPYGCRRREEHRPTTGRHVENAGTHRHLHQFH